MQDYTFSDEQTLTEYMKEELRDELFDFIREEEDFKQIVKLLNNV